MKKIYLVRHGEVEARYQKRFRGVIDCELSDFGKTMSEANANFFAQTGIDLVITSGLKRADYVGQLLAQKGFRHETNAGFREAHFGEWEGKTWAEVESLYPVEVATYQGDFDHLRFPNGESIPEIKERLLKAWEETLKRPETRIAIVGHSTCNTRLLAHLKGLKFREVTFQVIGSFHELEVDGIGNQVKVVRENVVLY